VKTSAPSRWHRFWHGPPERADQDDGPVALEDLRIIRDRMRRQYLQRAAEQDKLIGEFNNTLSRDLWHLERMRLTPERAARKFDEVMTAVDLDILSS
jgi:hypothetical protein